MALNSQMAWQQCIYTHYSELQIPTVISEMTKLPINFTFFLPPKETIFSDKAKSKLLRTRIWFGVCQ
jgi:hypothetical protein